MTDEHQPPVAKYSLTLKITGNTHDEIERALAHVLNGEYQDHTLNYTADEFHVESARCTSILEHRNPGQTPEKYVAELHEWFEQRKAARAEVSR